MEVEARMKRNYLPPSIQYQGYQSPPNPAGSQIPQSPTSVTHSANYPQQNNQKSMKPSLETIPQGTMMANKGSIVSGTPISQVVSQFSPPISQYSQSHGTMNQIQGSITSGTPVNNQGSILSGTPVCTGAFSSTSYQINYTQSQSNFGSITTGTPVNNPGNYGSITTGTPVNNTGNYGSITTGTPIQGSNYTTNYSSYNHPQTGNYGSITSGTPVNSYSSQNTGSYSSIMNQIDQRTSTGVSLPPNNIGSITSGTPMITNQSEQGNTFGSNRRSVEQNIGNTDFSMAVSSYSNQSMQSLSNVASPGSITTGTPLKIYAGGNISSSTPNFASSTPLQSQNTGNYAINTLTNYTSQNVKGLNSGSSFGSITTGTPISHGSFHSPNTGSAVPAGSITAGTPVPPAGAPGGTFSGTPSSSGTYPRQRKYSGPPRVKLQMLATVKEMGNCFFFSF